jgi:hypothetical protein
VLYPLSIVYYLADFATAFNLFIILHIFLGGVFFYLLMRGLKFERPAALIAGVVFSYSGYLISVINLTTTLAAAVWFPLAFLFYTRLIQRGKFTDLVLTSMFLAFMFLGGEPTPFYASVFLLGLYTLMNFFTTERKNFGIFLMYASGVGVALLLLAFQILPFGELIRLSDRMLGSFEKATFWSFHPRYAVDFLLPFFYGPLNLDLVNPLRQDWMLFSYLGVVPVILFAIAFIFRKDKCTVFFKLSFLIGLIFAFGRFTPVYKIFYKFMPGFGLIRYPVKFFFISAVAFAYLAGAGFSEYRERIKKSDPTFLKFIKALFICGFIATIIFLLLYIFREKIVDLARVYSEKLKASETTDSGRFYSVFFADFFNLRRMLVFFILGVLFMFIACRKKLNPATFSLLIIGLIFVDLYGGKNIQVNVAVPRKTLAAVTPNVEILKKDRSLFRIYTSYRQSKSNELLRGRTYEEAMFNSIDALCPNRPMEHGIYSVRGYLSVHNARYDKILILLDTAPFPSATNILNMLNVKYIVTPDKIKDPGVELVRKSPATYLYRNKNVLPRAYLASEYTVLTNEAEIAERMKSKDFNPAEEVILEEKPSLASYEPSGGSHNSKESVEIITYEPNEIIIEVTVKEKPKFLVLADNYYPGWEVAVDGKKDKIYKADFILRGVYLLPGEHRVRFFFNPLSFKIGSLISLLTIFSLIGAGLFIKRNTLLRQTCLPQRR